MKYRLPRGTQDILPDKTHIWQWVEHVCRRVFERYNYQEIRTPIFEETELFVRSIGESTDIVGKEMFAVGEEYSLRPEETAPVVRAVLQNGLLGEGGVIKLYYLGPMFRRERPQKGRFRQFHQAGVEAFGSSDPLLDVEQIALNLHLFDELHLKNLILEINSLGCPGDKAKYRQQLKDYFILNRNELCEDCHRRLEQNPLRILDCKNKKCQKTFDLAPSSLDGLCEDCKFHFAQVIEGLNLAGIKYAVSKCLVRGLDYYTGTTFEIRSKMLGAQDALSGGGRYDHLVEELGGKPVPAVGFAVGIERLMLAMEGQGVKFPSQRLIKLFLVTLGDHAKRVGFNLLSDLRRSGVSGEIDYFGRSLKAQMREAGRLGVEYVVIIGDNELQRKVAVLKRMADGHQEEVKLEEIYGKING